jgi:hypothetical protein
MEEIIPYCASTIPGQCKKPYWGARVQQIKEQHSRYMPAKYVPNCYDLAPAGLSGALSASVQAILVGVGASAAIGTEHDLSTNAVPNKRTRNYNKKNDDKVLIEHLQALNKEGIAFTLKKGKDIEVLANQMSLAHDAIKRALKRLEGEGKIQCPK